MSAEGFDGDLQAAAAIDAAAASEPNLSAEVAKVMPVRRRVRPLTSEGIALRQSLTDAEAAARAAHYALEAANVRAARYYRALFIVAPVSLALGALLGRLA